MPIFQFLINRK